VDSLPQPVICQRKRTTKTRTTSDAHRVLEIGTGTGYNAALLAHRLGDGQVVSIEVDPQVAEQTRHALARAGFAPTVITADGSAGYPAGAPYDRVIATCSALLGQVPYQWVAQTRAGGRLVVPVHRPHLGPVGVVQRR
jgi:protein-L-isoaspartate O-methyltransferase